MPLFLCRRCGVDLTQIFLDTYEKAIKKAQLMINSVMEHAKELGVKATPTIKDIGGDITCPECGLSNHIEIDSVDQIEEMIMEMNR